MRTSLNLLLLLCFAGHALAQESAAFRQPGNDFRLASELVSDRHYGPARLVLDRLETREERETETIREFFDAISAAELNNGDAPARIGNFVANYPENALAGEASIYLGKILFREGRYKDAIKAFQAVKPSGLSKEGREEMYFMTGYAHLKSGDNTSAKNYFQRVGNQNSPYYGQSRYYIAHIDYLQGNYQQALKTFEQIENDRRYQKIVPIYKIHIYHYLEDYAQVMAMGPGLIESAGTTGKPEIARITGNAFFNSGDYSQAAYYLDIFERTNRKSLSREDNYLLGFVSYLAGDHQNAINNFQQAIKQNDALSQNAYYYLGACYNETGQKKYAGNAFLSAYKAGFDPELSEEALFNYIRISLESPFNPYNEAISLLEKYLKDNPASPRADEGYGYLSQLYLSSRNYKQALASMESTRNKDKQLQGAYQKILYYRAAELFNANDLEGAFSLYKKASELKNDEAVRAESLYWMGEIAYRQQNYTAAIQYLKDFLTSAASKKSAYASIAQYNLGYAHFNRKNYPEAISSFNRYLESSQGRDRKLASDAWLRLGDSYFISKKYDQAISYYDKVITARENAMDYALYYKALSEGAKGDYNRKIDVLKVLINNYPKSGYIDEALYETALAYLLLNQENNALTYFDKLIQAFPANTKSVQALMRKGFIYFNRSDYSQAIASFKAVTDKYPGSKESQEALAALKNIYLETGQIDQYYAYVKSVPFAAVDATEEDSLNYEVAQNLYMQGRCDQAIGAFRKYMERFPNGAYFTDALFYQSECYLKSGQKIQARDGFKQVASRPRSRFSEPALATASSMEYAEGRYAEALPLFEQLETLAEDPDNSQAALAGQMRCHYRLNNLQAAAGAAQRLTASGTARENTLNEARFILGKSYLDAGDLTLAENELSATGKLTGTEMGAESAYMLASISFQKGQLQDAEEKVYSLAEKFAAFDYWVAKGFILLSDIFVQTGNNFQARETLQSVIDNYSGPELGDVARRKLQALGN